MVNHAHKFIFVHIPKTGGHTIERHFGAWENPKGKYSVIVGGGREHFGLWKILKRAPGAKDYFKFTFVRNPWDKLLSEYFYMLKPPIGWREKKFVNQGLASSFKSFVLNDGIRYCRQFHAKPQHKFFKKGSMDFVGRFENFEEDWNFICTKIGIQPFKLPILNKTDHKYYTEYYDDETRKIVAEKYAKDIERFGYKFGD